MMKETDLSADPLEQFGRWYEEAEAAEVAQPEAIALATAGPDGAPSLRMVLLKQFDERGFAFFTNLGSRKARELETNPRAALLSFWQPLGRQVRVEGAITPVNRDEVEHYARSRSRDSQLSALASPQSDVDREPGVARAAGGGPGAGAPGRRAARGGRLGRIQAPARGLRVLAAGLSPPPRPLPLPPRARAAGGSSGSRPRATQPSGNGCTVTPWFGLAYAQLVRGTAANLERLHRALLRRPRAPACRPRSS